MKYLTLTDSLGEQAGGLAHASLNLAFRTAIQMPDHGFYIVSGSDMNEIDIDIYKLPNLEILKVPCLRNQVFPINFRLASTISSINPDLIHLKGLWRQGSIAACSWKLKNPNKSLIVQTAGMLEPWARNRNSLLKSIYYRLFEKKLIDLCDQVHATSAREVANLEKAGIRNEKILLLEEGIEIPANLPSKEVTIKPIRTLLFLSRIHPVKGIEVLLEAFSLLRPKGWICKIAGMGSSAYQQKLQEKCKTYALDQHVQFIGALKGDSKRQAFLEADAFILPSYTESFGIAVAEAMSYGLPVITTTETPWDCVEALGLGWRVAPNVHSLSKALFELFQSSDQQLHKMGKLAQSYVFNQYSWDAIAERLQKHYADLTINSEIQE